MVKARKKRKIGRPSKFTKARCDKILKLVRAGNYVEIAARASGVNETNLYEWLERGRKEKSGPYRDFRDAYELAEAEAETEAVKVYKDAAERQAENKKNPDCKGIQGFLSRRFWKRWRERNKTEVTGENDGPVKMEVVFPKGVGFGATTKKEGS